MKVDTEGGEWQILDEPLARIDRIVLEVHDPPNDPPAEARLAAVADREGLELLSATQPRIRWLVRDLSFAGSGRSRRCRRRRHGRTARPTGLG